MKILKKFGSFVNEDLQNMAIEAPEMEAPETAPELNQPNLSTDHTEEEEEDKYSKMLNDLAESLGSEVTIDDRTGGKCVQYEGKTINVYSEDDMYHVDKKKFKTLDEVVSFLKGGQSLSKNNTSEIEEEEIIEEGWRDERDTNPDFFDEEEGYCSICDCNPCNCEDQDFGGEFEDEFIEDDEFESDLREDGLDIDFTEDDIECTDCRNCPCTCEYDENTDIGYPDAHDFDDEDLERDFNESRITKKFKDFVKENFDEEPLTDEQSDDSFEDESFESWLSENDEYLKGEYEEYKLNMEMDKFQPSSFEKWAEEKYNSL